MPDVSKAENEIAHGKFLASGDAEKMWGWGSPAGKVRAERRGSLVSSAAQLSPESKVLEIGCGTGNFTEFFAQYGAHIVAVDISQELLEIARDRGLPQNQVEFVCDRFENLNLDNHFDAVIGSSVLHHLEIEPALQTIFKLLKPGGIIAFAEPNMLNPQIFAERTFLRKYLSQVSPDETAFVRWSFQKQLEDFGFKEISITPFDWLHPLIPKALIGPISFIGRILERIPIVREFSGSLLIKCIRPM